MNNEKVFQLLYPRVNNALIKGYYKGVLNAGNDKLYGLTYVPVLPSDLERITGLQSLVDGYTGWNMDPEKTKKYISATTYQLKSLMECLEEGIYNAYSLSFFGVYHKGAWHILPSLVFFGEKVTEAAAKESLERYLKDDQFFEKELFASRLPDEMRSAELEEFRDTPYLVALIKKRRKEKINAVYRQYIAEAVVPDIVTNLRIYYSQAYDSLAGLYQDHFTIIFPEHKRFLLLVTTAKGINEKEYSLRYLVYIIEGGQLFEWHYFPPLHISGFYGDAIISQLQTVSGWNSLEHLHSSCTLDDAAFWDEFVFRKENGAYKYLRELIFGDTR